MVIRKSRNKNIRPTINFLGRFNRRNNGPWIQGAYKKLYFRTYGADIPIKIMFGDSNGFNVPNYFIRTKHFHCLFPHDLRKVYPEKIHTNFSLGPNIASCLLLGQAAPKIREEILTDRWIVMDSYWAKHALCCCFDNVDPRKVIVIYTYKDPSFYEATMNLNEDFVIGMVGYPGHLKNGYERIKNLQVVFKLAKMHPEWKFEICTNRNHEGERQEFKNRTRHFENITVLEDVIHRKMPEIMSNWSCYLGIGKSERGPTTIQECKAIGCPTVCSDHTGYSEFDPTIALPIKPFKELNGPDIMNVHDALVEMKNNKEKYFQRAEKEKHLFWQEHNPEVITIKWKQFLYERYLEANG